MVLSVGQQLGRYEIIARLDSGGGMGEVYKARDTRLPRTVAIKVLGLHLAGKSDLRQRFEQFLHAPAEEGPAVDGWAVVGGHADSITDASRDAARGIGQNGEWAEFGCGFRCAIIFLTFWRC